MEKSLLQHIRSRARRVLERPVTFLANRFGYNILSKSQTMAYLSDCLIATYPVSRCLLPEVRHAVDPTTVFFAETEVFTFPSYVWQYECSHKPTMLLRSGLLLTDNTLLNTDYWVYDSIDALLLPDKRRPYRVQTLFAPFGHEFDDNLFVGYFDFMFIIAAKLCRIKESVPDAVFRTGVVSYPLVHTSYEREFLNLLGFTEDRVMDSRLVKVICDRCYLGNHDNWTYQNRADILLLKKHLAPLIQTPRTKQTRIYISRANRRRILNEEALKVMLMKHNFMIIDDQPRSLVEQFAIYRNASFIIGPHGASFTNILWCEPGAHLFELFNGHFAPPHFLYLAQLLGLQYTAYSQATEPVVNYRSIADDFYVSIPELDQCLEIILKK